MNRFEFRYRSEFNAERNVEEIVAVLRVNGQEPGALIALRELVASTAARGEFWIFTCSCGYHECAGIDEGVRVTHWNRSIFWQVRQNLDGRSSDPTIIYNLFEFDRSSYIDSIRQALAYAKSRVKFSPYQVELLPYRSRNLHYIFNLHVAPEC